jgi:hypothetical protein
LLRDNRKHFDEEIHLLFWAAEEVTLLDPKGHEIQQRGLKEIGGEE